MGNCVKKNVTKMNANAHKIQDMIEKSLHEISKYN